MKDGSHAHEEQTLEKNVVEGMGERAVDGKLGADSDSDHHEADLVDHAVAENAAQVVLDNGVEDREHGHDGSDRN